MFSLVTLKGISCIIFMIASFHVSQQKVWVFSKFLLNLVKSFNSLNLKFIFLKEKTFPNEEKFEKKEKQLQHITSLSTTTTKKRKWKSAFTGYN